MNIACLVVCLLFAGMIGSGCRVGSNTAGEAPPDNSFIGTLEGGMMAIGGETSGWVLKREAEKDIELQIDAVGHEALEPLDGQRVRITGHQSHKDYVERGRVPVIVVESIEPHPAP